MKLQIKAYPEARELWSLCSSNKDAPDEPHMNDERAVAVYAQRLNQYPVRATQVKSILLQTISTGQLHVVAQQGSQNLHAMWQELLLVIHLKDHLCQTSCNYKHRC